MSNEPLKCFTMKICRLTSTPKQFKYKIENHTIKQVENCKDLGLWIDDELNLKTRINKVHNRLQQNLYHLYFLQKTGLHLRHKTILQIYKSESRPMIEY